MKATYKNLTIESKFKGIKHSNWSNENQHTHHNIIVFNDDVCWDIDFDFWASINEPRIETEEQLLNAFQCFISDCLVGVESYENFISEFGYEDNKETEEIYSICVNTYRNFTKISDENIYDFANELEIYIEENFQ